MLFSCIPSILAASMFAVAAMTCSLNSWGLLVLSENQDLADRKLTAVSMVLNDFETMTNRVVSGFSFFVVSKKLFGSTFEIKWTLTWPVRCSCRASIRNFEPRCEPPIPIWTMSVKGFCVNPLLLPSL